MTKLDQKINEIEDKLAKVIQAVDKQARLLGAIVVASDHITKAYVALTQPPEEKK